MFPSREQHSTGRAAVVGRKNIHIREGALLSPQFDQIDLWLNLIHSKVKQIKASRRELQDFRCDMLKTITLKENRGKNISNHSGCLANVSDGKAEWDARIDGGPPEPAYWWNLNWTDAHLSFGSDKTSAADSCQSRAARRPAVHNALLYALMSPACKSQMSVPKSNIHHRVRCFTHGVPLKPTMEANIHSNARAHVPPKMNSKRNICWASVVILKAWFIFPVFLTFQECLEQHNLRGSRALIVAHTLTC